MNMDEAIQVSCINDKLPPSCKDFKHILKHNKEELTLVELGSHLRIEEYNDNKGKRKHQDTKGDPNKKSKVTCWKCRKPGHLKKDFKGGKVGNKANGSCINGLVNGSINSLKGHNMFNKYLQVYYVTYVSKAYFMQNDNVAWWVDSRTTVHVCKDRWWFKTYESLNDGSILHMGNKSTALVHGRGCVDLRFSSGKIVSLFKVLHVPNIMKSLVLSSILNNCGYKQAMSTLRMQDMSKDGLIPPFDIDTEKCKTCMLTKITKNPFQNVKRKTKVLELIHSDLCDLHSTPSLGNKKYFVTFIDDALSNLFLLTSMGDENLICTLGDDSKPSHEGYRNTIELPEGNNVVPLRSDTIRGPHDTQYRMENLEQAFVEYASSRTNEAGGKWYTFKPEQNNLVLEVLAHAPMYNAILDKYVGSLEIGKNRSAFIQGEIPKRMEDLGLFTLPCRIGEFKTFDTLVDLGSCVNIIPLYLFKKLNIGLLEETDHVFGLADRTKSYPVGIVRDVEVHIERLKL
ncbi:zinc finger, CCHC-type containing protein [Tanacetum coccineum]